MEEIFSKNSRFHFHRCDVVINLIYIYNYLIIIQFCLQCQVTSVSLTGEFDTLSTFTHSFAELFPLMEQLALNEFQCKDATWVQNVTNLTHLNCSNPSISYFRPGQLADSYYATLIKNNPKIRYFKATHVTHDLIKLLADNTPELEALELSKYHDFSQVDANVVNTFDNVKYLKIEQSDYSLPKNSYFTNVEELHINFYQMFDCSRWIELLRNSPHLTKLTLLTIDEMKLIKLKDIPLNVTDTTLSIRAENYAPHVIEFIKNCNLLDKLHLIITTKTLDSTMEQLKNHFDATWEMEGRTNDFVRSEIFLKRIKNVDALL